MTSTRDVGIAAGASMERSYADVADLVRCTRDHKDWRIVLDDFTVALLRAHLVE